VERLGALHLPFNAIIKLHGIGRFRLLSLTPEVRLYLSPIQFDPEKLRRSSTSRRRPASSTR